VAQKNLSIIKLLEKPYNKHTLVRIYMLSRKIIGVKQRFSSATKKEQA